MYFSWTKAIRDEWSDRDVGLIDVYTQLASKIALARWLPPISIAATSCSFPEASKRIGWQHVVSHRGLTHSGDPFKILYCGTYIQLNCSFLRGRCGFLDFDAMWHIDSNIKHQSLGYQPSAAQSTRPTLVWHPNTRNIADSRFFALRLSAFASDLLLATTLLSFTPTNGR